MEGVVAKQIQGGTEIKNKIQNNAENVKIEMLSGHSQTRSMRTVVWMNHNEGYGQQRKSSKVIDHCQFQHTLPKSCCCNASAIILAL